MKQKELNEWQEIKFPCAGWNKIILIFKILFFRCAITVIIVGLILISISLMKFIDVGEAGAPATH